MESLLSASASCIDEEDCYESSTNLSSTNTNNTNNTSSNLNNTNTSIINTSRRRLSPNRKRAKYIADIEEVRINSIVSKKGYLNFLEEKSVGWNKKFVVNRFYMNF